MTILALIALIPLQSSGGAVSEQHAHFEARVAPVLERACVHCHGGFHAEGGVSLVDGASAPDPARILAALGGPSPAMPKAGPPLSAQELADLELWVETGAPWPEGRVLQPRWWSLEPLVRPSVPEPSSPSRAWRHNSIDGFVQRQLEQRGLGNGIEAERRDLVRRLSFDLHGLPPTRERVEAFVADERPDAYERLVDELLASPRYGERQARHWLDVARYADTHGYDKDKPRPNAWPYRDWVVDAFNADMPWSEFVQRQLAADVLYPDEPDAAVATGFLAAGPWDFVGHVEVREGTLEKARVRLEDRDEMVSAVGAAFLGLTVQCARCHDHPFDHVRQADYYALQAVFSGVERADRMFEADAQSARARAELLAERARIEVEIEALVGEPRPTQSTLGWHSAIEASAEHEKWVQVDLGASVEIEELLLAASHEAYGGHPGPGFGFPPRFHVQASDDASFVTGRTLLVDQSAADFPNPGDELLRFEVKPSVRGRYVRVTATRLWERTNDYAFALGELAVYSSGRNLARDADVDSLDTIEAGGAWGQRYLVDGVCGLTSLSEERMRRDPEIVAALERIEVRQAAIDVALAALPPTRAVYAARPLDAGVARPVHVLVRGDVARPLEAAAPGAVAIVPASFECADDEHEGERRAALARWLVDPANPLGWRVAANRIWASHFERGLTELPDDLGRMGALPTHPELLDWLACELRDGDQSLKSMHKLIVMSQTYRKSSRASATGDADHDPENRWLVRASRRRLSAEELHDALLFASGELDLTPGGPSYARYAFEDDHSPRYLYEQHDPRAPHALRRALYRSVVRSVPDPFFAAFDAADASSPVSRRDETTTPAQALALWNGEFALARAEALAGRAGAGGVRALFSYALQREPTELEREELEGHALRHGLPAAARIVLNLAEFQYVD